MPIESATYVNDLTPANPLGSDPAGQGDDHLRLLKSVLLATLPNMGQVFGQVRQLDTAQTISATWNRGTVVCTNSATATVVLTLPNSASITTGWSQDIFSATCFTVLTPQAGGSINGNATFTLPPNTAGRVFVQTGGIWRANMANIGQGTAVFGSVSVSGAAVLSGAVTMAGTVGMSNGASISGTLSVNGGLAVSGSVQFNGPITAILGQANITGIVNATGGTVRFPSTQIPSASANDLDDYEEGTWTPTVTCAVPGNLAITYATRNGFYTKIGRVVQIQMHIATSAFTHTTANNEIYVTGLPFTPSASTAGHLFYDGLAITMGTTFGHLTAFINGGNPVIFYLLCHCNSGNGALLSMSTNHASGVNHQARSDVTYIV